MMRRLRVWWAYRQGTVAEWAERVAIGGSVRWK